MFTTPAELYDAIYFTFKDYATEAAEIAGHVRRVHPGAHTILDVACGTGEHARLLASDHGFAVDGIDLNADFLRLASRKHPAGRFVVADMVEFDLGRQYDAVICMFSSIGYVQTLAALERALVCLRRHLAPGGVLLVEPWFPPGKLQSGHHSERTAVAGRLSVHRMATTAIEGRMSRLQFDYTLVEDGEEQRMSETHELGLFTEAETLEAFDAAGLAARHEAESPSNRGLYVARLST
jgi:SAM-dependent methyltransferase